MLSDLDSYWQLYPLSKHIINIYDIRDIILKLPINFVLTLDYEKIPVNNHTEPYKFTINKITNLNIPKKVSITFILSLPNLINFSFFKHFS